METEINPASSPVPKRWFAKRSVWIVIAAAVALSVGIWVVYKVVQSHQAAKVNSALGAADAASAKGDFQGALDQLAGAVDNASTKSDKVKVYDSLAAAAASKGDVGNAIHYYQLKHQLDPSTEGQDAQLLGDLYARSNQPDQALAQYKLALSWLKSQPQTQLIKNQIQSLQVNIQAMENQ